MNLYRAFATVSGLTLLSRMLGFARDVLMAGVLGSGLVADAFLVAFRFPNLFRRVLGEGALNAAFVPLFAKRLEVGGAEAAHRFAGEAISGLLLVLTALTVLAELAMPWIIRAFAPGFAATPEKLELAVTLTRIAFPYLVCMSFVALVSGVLNALGRFTAAAAAPVLLNVVLIAALGLAWKWGLGAHPAAGRLLAWAVTIAGIAQLLLVVVAARRAGVALQLVRPEWTENMQSLVRRGIPGLISGGVTQINIFIGTIIASLQAGAVSHLYYADRLYQLPLGIVGVAIGVILLPELSRHLAAKNEPAAQESQNRALELSLLLTLPAAAGLVVAAEPIIRVLFERGAFTPQDTDATASALAAFAIGLPAFVLIKVLQPAFFAREDTRTPMYFTIANLLINAVGSLVLFYWFRWRGMPPHVGIALATSIAGWVNALALAASLRARGHLVLDARARRCLPSIGLASGCMALVVWSLFDALAPLLTSGRGVAASMATLGALVATGTLVYAIALFATGVLDRHHIRRLRGRRE